MPAKYSHVKKRSAARQAKKAAANGQKNGKDVQVHRPSDPHVDKSINQALTAVSQLERAIARILLIRYEQDIARLFSTRIYSISLIHLPTFMMRCISVGGPSWVAWNADSDEIKDFFRAAISMDMRQAGERVSTKSVLWSYTALRHFAISNNVSICKKRGLHSLRLLPYFPALKAHLDVLESMPAPSVSKPPHLGPLTEGIDALEEAIESKYGKSLNEPGVPPEWDHNWRPKVRLGYERATQTLWKVAKEFDVKGYGLTLREKLTTKWCDCGCSTDHLGEVCERTVRDDESESGVRPGKQREWDGRGSGIHGWETEEEEDIWEVDLDFGGAEPDDFEEGAEAEMSIGELMDWRFLKAEKAKEEGNNAFRKGDLETAVKHYETAHQIEPELPHYQLNLAAAHLKLNNWIEAEKACNKALGQHRSGKGYYRRAKARKMLGLIDDALRDLRAVLKFQPSNVEAQAELLALLPPTEPKSPSQESTIEISTPISRPISSSPKKSSPKHPQEASSSSSSSPPQDHASSSSSQPAQDQSSSSSSSSKQTPPSSPPEPPRTPTKSQSVPNSPVIKKVKGLKPPPFTHHLADDRKLKIVILPTVLEIPGHAKCSDACSAKCFKIAREKMRKDEANGDVGWDWDGPIKKKPGVRMETYLLPGWEKYIVRRD